MGVILDGWLCCGHVQILYSYSFTVQHSPLRPYRLLISWMAGSLQARSCHLDLLKTLYVGGSAWKDLHHSVRIMRIIGPSQGSLLAETATDQYILLSDMRNLQENIVASSVLCDALCFYLNCSHFLWGQAHYCFLIGGMTQAIHTYTLGIQKKAEFWQHCHLKFLHTFALTRVYTCTMNVNK